MKTDTPTQKELFLALWQARTGMLACDADGEWQTVESTGRIDDWLSYWDACGKISDAILENEKKSVGEK